MPKINSQAFCEAKPPQPPLEQGGNTMINLKKPFSVLRSPFSVLRSPFSVLRSPFSVLSLIRRNFTFVLVTLILTLSACLSPYHGDKGSLTINFGPGSGGAGRSIGYEPGGVGPGGDIGELEFRLHLSGPGGNLTETVQGADTVRLSLAPGNWTVEADARYQGVLYAESDPLTVTIGAGANNNVTLIMRPATKADSGEDFVAGEAVNYMYFSADDTPTALETYLTGIIGTAGNYAVIVEGTQHTIQGNALIITASNVKISLRGSGTVTLGATNGSMFTLDTGGTGNKLILRGPKLLGKITNDAPLVAVTSSEFVMYAGEISGNTNNGANGGGGVYVSNNATFTMNGGAITGNNASIGKGVYNAGGFNISGTALINANNDVYLEAGKTITVTGTLTNNVPLTLSSYTSGTPVLTLGFPAAAKNRFVFKSMYFGIKNNGTLDLPAVVIPPGGEVIWITSQAELAAINNHNINPAYNNGKNAYILANDITLTGTWTPIGQPDSVDNNGNFPTGTNCFTGNFYGGRHTIHGLLLPGGTVHYIGLFGWVKDAILQDFEVELATASITLDNSSAQRIGGIAGTIENTNVSNCGVYSAIPLAIDNNSFQRAVDLNGIASSGSSTIVNCYAAISLTANVTATHLNIYGISGASDSTIQNCYFVGTLDGMCSQYVSLGGISLSSIQECYAAGILKSTNAGPDYSSTGGLATHITSSVRNSVALQSSIIHSNNNNYARIQKAQDTDVGTPAVLTNNYAYSGMELGNTAPGAPVTGTYENDQTGLDKSAAELKQRSTYETGLGWDFTNTWEMGPSSYPFPILKWQKGIVHIPTGFTVIE